MIFEIAFFGIGFSLILNNKYPHPFGETEYHDLFRICIYGFKGKLLYNRRLTKAYERYTYLEDYFVSKYNGMKTCFFIGSLKTKYGFILSKDVKDIGKYTGLKF